MSKNKYSHIQTGRSGEDNASEHLLSNGLKILGRNIRTPFGEIDILCEEGDCLIFLEVKTRRSKQFGFPEDAVSHSKQEHMLNSAMAYLQEQDALERTWRIDVIAVNLVAGALPDIQWFKNAITC
jgi:putative endonuclease